MTITDYAEFFRIMSNESRLRLLKTLYNSKPVSVNHLSLLSNVPLSKICDQLTVLRKYDYVKSTVSRTKRYYYNHNDKVLDILTSYCKKLGLEFELKYDGVNIGSFYNVIRDPFNLDNMRIYKLLANDNRCSMLVKIFEKELSVKDMCGMYYLEQPTISMHLIDIRKEGLVKGKKVGKLKYYYI